MYNFIFPLSWYGILPNLFHDLFVISNEKVNRNLCFIKIPPPFFSFIYIQLVVCLKSDFCESEFIAIALLPCVSKLLAHDPPPPPQYESIPRVFFKKLSNNRNEYHIVCKYV